MVGRIAVVTGAGNGLGRAISIALDAAGATVVLAGRDVGNLETTASLLAGESFVAPVDVADPGSVTAMHDRVSSWVAARARRPGEPSAEDGSTSSAVTILVNNAGVAGPVAALTDVTPAEWDDVFAVNVRGTYLMCQAFIPAMAEGRTGDIVNLASVSGKRPLVGRTPYTASKMAVIGLTTTLAHEVGPLGIKVNTLSPGPVEGPRMQRNFTREAVRTGLPEEEVRREFVLRAAMQRMVTEQEVAEAVLSIVRLGGLTGADIDLSAGMVAR
ncbi:SDR family oxidoreductase [Jiangella muralis]|uniref:SDR family NAD(P)-dependent oxidoreductase n=1 Tax=Jiangella muralis TaxID=702383 RepID=UPI00069F57C3